MTIDNALVEALKTRKNIRLNNKWTFKSENQTYKEKSTNGPMLTTIFNGTYDDGKLGKVCLLEHIDLGFASMMFYQLDDRCNVISMTNIIDARCD